MKTHIVTGGAGFLGYHLCKSLLEAGDQVFCFDNMSSGTQRNVNDLELYENFRFLHHDVTEPLSHKLWEGIDCIWHLACPASPPFYQAFPVQTMMTCVVGTKNMLDLAKSNNCPILFTSTSEVYGDPLVTPQHEAYRGNVTIDGIRSCYDEGKRAAESLCSDYRRVHGLDVRVVRLFNTYGPNMRHDDGRVVSNFINQALAGEPLTIYGSGGQTRSLCYVSDTIAALLLVMRLTETPPVMNIGNAFEVTILDIASRIRSLVGNTTSGLVMHPLPADDPKIRKPATDRIQSLTGWEPQFGLTEGLTRTISYFRSVTKT